MEVVNTAQKEHTLPQTVYEATLSVIPEPGRDCDAAADYRPISLIN